MCILLPYCRIINILYICDELAYNYRHSSLKRAESSLLLIQAYNLVLLLFVFVTFRKAKEIVKSMLA